MTSDTMDTENELPKLTLGQRMEAAGNRHIDRLVDFMKAARAPLFLGAAMFAFLTQPMVRFIDVYAAYSGAFAFGMAAILLTVAITLGRDLMGIVVGVVGLGLGWWLIGNVIDDAAKRAAVNDQRCFLIEKEMLSAKPRRDDLPDIFNALGCHPQTNLHLSYPS